MCMYVCTNVLLLRCCCCCCCCCDCCGYSCCCCCCCCCYGCCCCCCGEFRFSCCSPVLVACILSLFSLSLAWLVSWSVCSLFLLTIVSNSRYFISYYTHTKTIEQGVRTKQP